MNKTRGNKKERETITIWEKTHSYSEQEKEGKKRV
jgi:hypothetical protein